MVSSSLSVSTTRKNENDDHLVIKRQTHIEVCARLRPLQTNNLQSSSFFKKEETSHSTRKTSKNKSGLPRPPSSSSSLSSRSPRSVKSVKLPPNQHPNQPPTYAWNVVAKNTAVQNPETNVIQGRTHAYTLDRVYGPECNTKQMYEQSVQPLIHAAMEGYHTSVLAYGQTSTGKTFTMTGVPSSPGLIPMSIYDCFQHITSQHQQQTREYLLRLSYLEVYKEHIRDLLADETNAIPVRLFDDKKNGLIIKGLKEYVVTSPKQVFEILAQGEKRRQVGATQMNQHSSRSHVMVRLWIESSHMNPTPMSSSAVRLSSLSLVDLAGSESVKLNGTTANRRSEGHYINKSLMTLGQVVNALSDQKNSKNPNVQSYIPYRDSKLTRLLQPSLSGNAQMVLITCISPNVSHIEESHNTFKFAARAKKIPQKATIKETSGADDQTLLQTYRNEIEQLKQQLQEAKQQQERLVKEKTKQQYISGPTNTDNNLTLLSDSEEENEDDEVHELVEAIQTMEKLILKSKALPETPDSLLVDGIDDLFDDSDHNESAAIPSNRNSTTAMTVSTSNSTENEEAILMAMVDDSNYTSISNINMLSTPSKRDQDLTKDLHRIQGLLSSVIKKKKTQKRTGISIDSKNSENLALDTEEIQNLREKLEQQEVATSLRKADSTFLQKQLEEKDHLLQEVYKILEAVEERQVQLENENILLRKQVLMLRKDKEREATMKQITEANNRASRVSEITKGSVNPNVAATASTTNANGDMSKRNKNGENGNYAGAVKNSTPGRKDRRSGIQKLRR